MKTLVEELKRVPLKQIHVNPYQPRRVFSPEELEDLAASIQAVGLIHPPAVRPLPNGEYELISGERRLRASQHLGLTEIPVLVRDAGEVESAQAALIENVQRVDLNPLEVALAMKRLMEEFGWNQEEVAKRVGKRRSTVANYLRLLHLPTPVQRSLNKGLLTMGHAKVVLSIKEPMRQLSLHERILRDELTVRQAEEVATRYGKPATTSRKPTENEPHIEALIRKIEDSLGTKVSFESKGSKGKITIQYYSLDDLDRLLEKLGITPD